MGLEPGTLAGSAEEEQEAGRRDVGEGYGLELEKRRQRRVRACREARGVKEQKSKKAKEKKDRTTLWGYIYCFNYGVSCVCVRGLLSGKRGRLCHQMRQAGERFFLEIPRNCYRVCNDLRGMILFPVDTFWDRIRPSGTGFDSRCRYRKTLRFEILNSTFFQCDDSPIEWLFFFFFFERPLRHSLLGPTSLFLATAPVQKNSRCDLATFNSTS